MLNGVPRILIIRLSAIGDVVRVLPALHALRDLYPHAQIDWAVESKSANILDGHPSLDQVHIFERKEAFLESSVEFKTFLKTIKAGAYDLVIDFHGILKSGLIMRASKAKDRLAFAPPRSQEMSHLFANKKIALPSHHMNRIEENLELCKALGAKRHSLDVIIHVPDDIQDSVDLYFEENFHGAKKVVLVHAPVERPEKQWPLEHYAALCDMLMSDGRYEVILTWGPGQQEVVDKVMRKMRRNPHISPQTHCLQEFAWMAYRSNLYFGGDTGPMHIASAMGTPVVAVFGGTDPKMHAPMRQPSRVLYEGPEPFPGKITVEKGQEYLAAINPEVAYDACVEMLRLSTLQEPHL